MVTRKVSADRKGGLTNTDVVAVGKRVGSVVGEVVGVTVGSRDGKGLGTKVGEAVGVAVDIGSWKPAARSAVKTSSTVR